MLNILVKIIVRLLGGFWELKKHVSRNPGSFMGRFYKLLYYSYLNGYGSYIGWKSEFAGPPCLPHGFSSLWIAGGTKIGKNCVIFPNVAMAHNSLPFSKTIGFPKIGDNCLIGPGAQIIGGVRIGNNCRIAANTTVFSDVPDDSFVISQDPKIIHRTGMINRFYKDSPRGPVYFQDGNWVMEEDGEIISRLDGNL